MLRRSSRFDTLRGVRGKSFRRMMRNVKIALTNYNPFSDFFFLPALARAHCNTDLAIENRGKPRAPPFNAVRFAGSSFFLYFSTRV